MFVISTSMSAGGGRSTVQRVLTLYCVFLNLYLLACLPLDNLCTI